MYPSIIIIAASTVLQIVAVVLSLRLIRTSRRTMAWILLSTSLALMTLQRYFLLVKALDDPDSITDRLYSDGIGLVVSASMVVGFSLIGPIFRALYRDRDALRNERDFVSRLIQASPTLFLVADREGRILLLNDALRSTLGIPKEDKLGDRSILDFLPSEESATFAALCRDPAEVANKSPHQGELLDASGNIIRLEWHFRPMTPSEGFSASIFAIGLDITERQRAAADLDIMEQQLRQSQKMEAIGRLAGGVAHDFNNLLTTILGNAEVLAESVPSGERAARQVKRIQDAGRRAADLTRQLLFFSRTQVPNARPMDINKVVSGLRDLMERALGEDIRFSFTGERGLWLVRGDPTQMEQVLLNLAVNARDAMERGGDLEIRTRNVILDEAYARTLVDVMPGPYVLLEVSDTGCGMSPDVLSRAFDPFFTTKEDGMGTGLGLSIVYGIVRGMGGHTRVQSEPSLGTTFRIAFPATQEPMWAEAMENQVRPDPGTGQRILVVEDDEGVRELVMELLGRAGYAVDSAHDAIEAMAFIESSGETQLLLTDVVLPRISGPELAGRARQIRPRLRVAYMSGYTPQVVTSRGILPPGAPYLQKPFSENALLQMVVSALEAPLPPDTPL